MKKAHIIGFTIIIICISVIIYTYTESSSYNTFTQASKKAGKEVYVLSYLDTSTSIYYNPLKDPNYMYFYALDSDNYKSKVIFHGPKPQDFERSEQLVMLGKFSSKQNAFVATKLLLKCPSKYTDEMPKEFSEKEFSSQTQN